MRNLKEYPVTIQDVDRVVLDLQSQFNKEEEVKCGDMRPATLWVMFKFIKEHVDEFNEYARTNTTLL